MRRRGEPSGEPGQLLTVQAGECQIWTPGHGRDIPGQSASKIRIDVIKIAQARYPCQFRYLTVAMIDVLQAGTAREISR
ncbi:MAG: hypothetical protein GWO08_20085, partial [Gammaproteobacteria bacterium]|nr:hypothetical protein [Phycisphaerae bacterium]NIR95844.1 hypothetical protein [Gammaproteobacteria bacterium]